MTERKFTDDQIIKAIKCLAGAEGTCVGCIYQSTPFPACRELVARQALDLINRQRAGIERFSDIGKMYSEIKAEAIKEFAERLKAAFPDRNDPRCTADDVFTLNYIDELVKEMTEGDQNENNKST